MTNYDTYIEAHISHFGLRNNDSTLSTKDAINIYENSLAALYDAKISYLANVAHGFAGGTWAKIIELMQSST